MLQRNPVMKSTSYSTVSFLFCSLLKVVARQSGKYFFFPLKLCWASSSTAAIRPVKPALDDQGLNKTCADRTSSFTSSKLCQASEYGLKYCGTYRRKNFPNLSKSIAFGQFKQRAVASTTSSSSTWQKLLGQFLMLQLPSWNQSEDNDFWSDAVAGQLCGHMHSIRKMCHISFYCNRKKSHK